MSRNALIHVIEAYLNSQQALLSYRICRLLQFFSITLGCIATYWYAFAVYIGLAGFYIVQFFILGLKPHTQMQTIVKQLIAFDAKWLKQGH